MFRRAGTICSSCKGAQECKTSREQAVAHQEALPIHGNNFIPKELIFGPHGVASFDVEMVLQAEPM